MKLIERFGLILLALAFSAVFYGSSILGCGGNPAPSLTPSSDSTPQKGIVHYISDHLGSANLMTDAKGKVLREESRYPYGLDWRIDGADVTTADYVYTGKEYDEETGLIYFGGRYYSPEMGRWVTPDPLFIENPENAVKRTLSSNLYAYVQNNPMTFVDDDGLIEKSAFELDQKIGTYSETTLEANTRIESIFQKTIGGGLVVMSVAPVITLATSAAPILSEASFTLSLSVYSAQSSLSHIAVEEAGIMWSTARAAANFALTHPEETVAFGKGLAAGLADANDVKMPETKMSNAVAAFFGEFIGENIREQVDNYLMDNKYEE